MWLILFYLLFCTRKIYNHQKFSKIGEVASKAVFDPIFQVIRENESTVNSEKKRELISDAKTPGEIFTANFTDKYAQIRLAKTQELTPRAETIVKKIEKYIKRWTDAISFVHDVFSPGSFQLNSHQGPISGTTISWFAKNATGREFWTFCFSEKNMKISLLRNFPNGKLNQLIAMQLSWATQILLCGEKKLSQITRN